LVSRPDASAMARANAVFKMWFLIISSFFRLSEVVVSSYWCVFRAAFPAQRGGLGGAPTRAPRSMSGFSTGCTGTFSTGTFAPRAESICTGVSAKARVLFQRYRASVPSPGARKLPHRVFLARASVRQLRGGRERCLNASSKRPPHSMS
jgi:hypothetical protein